MILSGANSYSGGTTVITGTLIVTSASAIDDNSNLTIGAGADQFIASSAPAAVTAAPVIAASAVASAGSATTAASDSVAAVPSAATAAPQIASSPVLFTLGAADAVHARLDAGAPPRFAAGVSLLGQTANNSDSIDQNRGKDAAILALEAIFANYGR